MTPFSITTKCNILVESEEKKFRVQNNSTQNISLKNIKKNWK